MRFEGMTNKYSPLSEDMALTAGGTVQGKFLSIRSVLWAIPSSAVAPGVSRACLLTGEELISAHKKPLSGSGEDAVENAIQSFVG